MPRVSRPAAPASRRKQVEKPRSGSGSVVGVEDLVGVQAGQRDLGGADQEEVVLGHLVDLVAVAGQEAGPVQRLFADQDRRHHRLVALAADQLDREADQGQLEHHQVALQVGEARAREPGRRPPCRSGPARCRSRGGRGARSRTRAARRPRAGRPRPPRSSRRGRRGRAGWAARRRPARAPPRPSPARPCRPRSSPSAPCTVGHQRPRPPRRAAWPRRSAWRASCARPGRSRSRAAARAGGRRGRAARRPARRRRAAPAPALTRSGSERISFRSSIAAPRSGRFLAGARRDSSASSPAYSATKRATASASSPTTMFWGMIAPEKPPFWIAKSASS